MNLYKRVLFFLFISLALNTTLSAGWGGLKYDNYAAHISNEIHKVFIKYDLCKVRNKDCAKKELLFISQAEPKISIYIYQVDNLQMIDEIIKIVMDEYQLAKRNGYNDLIINLAVFKQSHEELRKISFLNGLFNDYEFVNLTIKGEEK
jgi:hypothetical protein